MSESSFIGCSLLCCLVVVELLGLLMINACSSCMENATGRYVCGNMPPSAEELSNSSFPSCIQVQSYETPDRWTKKHTPSRPMCLLGGSTSYGPPIYCYENIRRTRPKTAFFYWKDDQWNIWDRMDFSSTMHVWYHLKSKPEVPLDFYGNNTRVVNPGNRGNWLELYGTIDSTHKVSLLVVLECLSTGEDNSTIHPQCMTGPVVRPPCHLCLVFGRLFVILPLVCIVVMITACLVGSFGDRIATPYHGIELTPSTV